MGLSKDLHLKGNDFSNAGSSFYVAYLVAEVLYSFILSKTPAATVMPIAMVLWGTTTACTAATQDYRTLVVARVFLGLFEAAIVPCLSLIVSQWYNKSEQASRFAVWCCGVGLGQLFGGILSFAFQHVQGSFAGWRALFIACGGFTVVLGVAVFFVIPRSPMDATFLSVEEKTVILQHMAPNKTGVLFRQIKLSHLKEMVLDPQAWLLMLTMIMVSGRIKRDGIFLY